MKNDKWKWWIMKMKWSNENNENNSEIMKIW